LIFLRAEGLALIAAAAAARPAASISLLIAAFASLSTVATVLLAGCFDVRPELVVLRLACDIGSPTPLNLWPPEAISKTQLAGTKKAARE
jgi:hypothetical protein